MKTTKVSLDNALQTLRAKQQAECDHPQQEITEIVPGTLHCWDCGKEWEKST